MIYALQKFWILKFIKVANILSSKPRQVIKWHGWLSGMHLHLQPVQFVFQRWCASKQNSVAQKFISALNELGWCLFKHHNHLPTRVTVQVCVYVSTITNTAMVLNFKINRKSGRKKSSPNIITTLMTVITICNIFTRNYEENVNWDEFHNMTICTWAHNANLWSLLHFIAMYEFILTKYNINNIRSMWLQIYAIGNYALWVLSGTPYVIYYVKIS